MQATGYRWHRTTTWTPTSTKGTFCCYLTSIWDFPSSQRQRQELPASTVDSPWIVSGIIFPVLLSTPGTGTTKEICSPLHAIAEAAALHVDTEVPIQGRKRPADLLISK
jgi:hypothetical protein